MKKTSFFLWNTLLPTIVKQYTLPLHGVHGIAHWARVFENGTRLAGACDANVDIVQLFALFHDSKRVNESRDSGHGRRGAEYAHKLRESGILEISDEDFDMLYFACEYHTNGLTNADITIQACWDADRLDLNRVGILPRTSRLCTDAARSPDMLAWANERAAQNWRPEFLEIVKNF